MDATGYGTASRGYALALDQLGVDVKIETYSWNFPFIENDCFEKEKLHQLIKKGYDEKKRKILIYHTPPGNVQSGKKYIRFDRRILNTVWETPKLPKCWPTIINKFDAVCVPCSQNIHAIKTSDVKIPAYLAPHGVDTIKYKPENKKFLLKEAQGRFVFVSVFDFQHRKNPESLLEAYWKEFTARDNVILAIKTYGDSRDQIMRKIKKYKQKLGFASETAPLIFLTGILDDIQFRGFYTMGNVFVLPTRGEGVGIPFMEALSSGIPVITTGWGGQMDFINENNSFLVDYELSYPGISMNSENTISKIYRNLYEEEGQIWAEAKVDDLRIKMREAYENQNLCSQKGHQGRMDMLKLSWNNVVLSLKHAIDKTIQ
ncbi:glycosyltransferase [Bacillus sp. FJAT-49705]|uniref:Glycosyltransferase n=1 Tax=Cytobacillus citreus TaxID=2833586 RepID=A0ABS5P020_9BACI|nr:glycosyltransferase [Cytobacillus citreus]MBS4192693.1 glycosyltransferase [Cytobacillus citreus]